MRLIAEIPASSGGDPTLLTNPYQKMSSLIFFPNIHQIPCALKPKEL